MVGEFIQWLKEDKALGRRITAHRYIPPEEPRYRDIELDRRVRELLQSRGISRFWSHQAEGIELVRRGRNVVVMTPTASGKSLVYNIPVVETILADRRARALYLFPLKGLEQDQVKNLNGLLQPLGIVPDSGPRRPLAPAEVYDGDTTAYRRKKIRERIPNVIFTNPDMLHFAINAYHHRWEEFFTNLRYVVIDEIHAYRGVFGSNVAQVLRRLRRICRRWGSEPQFIASSATIANPAELAERLVGLPFSAVTKSGAPQGGRHFLFINPAESAYTVATRLFVESIKAGLKTIVFAKARKITELIYTWAVKRAPELAGRISPYRAGFLPKERREIERRLFEGELSGVVSTSALELGVDIGGLDCCILAGYPGSVSSTYQRAGRVGRHGEESVVIMIALQDALDQYLARHPETFFGKSHEAAVIDPESPAILKKHLPCAAAEVRLGEDDTVYDLERLRPVVDELVRAKALRPGKKGGTWYSGVWMPHRGVSIRGMGEPFRIIDEGDNLIGELDGFRVFRDAFPGAIYLHRGRQYRVEALDTQERKVFVREVDVPYYTHALSRDETEILDERKRKTLGSLTLHLGGLRISQRVVGYEKRRLYDRARLSRHVIEMPEYVFDTEGVWFRIPGSIEEALEDGGFDLGGSIHALEHAAISCMPLIALCDKMDIGGVSHTRHPGFAAPGIFIYDGYEGGVGLTRHAFDVAGTWLALSRRFIAECPCESGCPSCVQDPQCGSGNQPLDKAGAVFLVSRILGREDG